MKQKETNGYFPLSYKFAGLAMIGKYRTVIVLTILYGISCVSTPKQQPIDYVKYGYDNEINCGDFILEKNLELGLTSGIIAPIAGCVDNSNNIYVLDKGDDDILVYSIDGKLIKTVSNLTDEKTTLPIIDFMIDDEGDVYLIDYDQNAKKASLRIKSTDSDLLASFEISLLPDHLVVTNRYVFISDRSYQNDYLVYAFSKDGKPIFGIEKTKRGGNPQETLIQNTIILGVDRNENIYLAHRFIPKVIKYSKEGTKLSEFEYRPQIKNRKRPIQVTMEQNREAWVKRSKEYPVCYDMAVDEKGMICLLVAADHAQPEKSALYFFDSSGTFKRKVDLPIYCSVFMIDHRGSYYFLGDSIFKPLMRYSRPPDVTISSDSVSGKEGEEQKTSLALKEQLAIVLKKCAEYSDKLGRTSMDFICEEEIIEEVTTYKDLQKVKNKYLYDYQLIRKNGKIQETRNMLKENGKKVNIKDAKLKTSAFKYQNIIFGPRVFNEYWRRFHNYQIIGEGTLNSKRAMIIEVTPTLSENDSAFNITKRNWLMSGRVWVDENDYSVLRIEMDKKSITDDWRIYERAKMYESEPIVAMTCEYDIERNGVRFPSKFSIEEAYINKSGARFTRAKINVAYKNYKYFTVETEEKIKKQDY